MTLSGRPEADRARDLEQPAVRSVGLSLTGCDCYQRWDTLSRRAVPDQHVRAQVGPVGPNDGAMLNARRLEDRTIVANRIEHRPDEQRFDVPIDR